jgi:hypothetical protein
MASAAVSSARFVIPMVLPRTLATGKLTNGDYKEVKAAILFFVNVI